MYVSTKLALQVWAGLVVALVSTLSFPIADQILLWNFVVCDHLWENLACGIFYEIEFDAYLINSTIELTHVQVSDRSRASLWSYSALFTIAPHPQ